MGQAAITSFPPGIYAGPMNTVYYRASGSLTATANTWLQITLDSAFNYTPSQSLIIEASQCGFTGTGFAVWQTAGTTGIIRRITIPGTTSCVFTYGGQDTRTLQCGVDIDPPIGIVNNNNTPSDYKLGQNYPNPFNPVTNINFSIPKDGFVNLTVYDILGIKVNELVNENIKAGGYSVKFDASDLSSGAYFYAIRVNNFIETKKMLLIK